MSDFNSWDELEQWLLDNDGEFVVVSGSWWFSKTSMGCFSDCCEDHFSSLDRAIDTIMRYARNDISKVWIME